VPNSGCRNRSAPLRFREQTRWRPSPLERLAETQQADVIRLTATEPEWRVRVGDWRVRLVYDFEQRVIRVERTRHRSQAYRD
jgi:mRNA-degrading endonuclease RelE of RelBE toxin-antitoxin system